uniref:PHD-type domain-containing protein n=2 Tax=Magallana gigas TaxID=29159 RepID=A0A8W8M3H4_MAGGI
AQSHTSLWHPYRDRQPGLTYGQLYSYPANRWKKRKRLAFMNTESRVNKSNEIETGESDVHQINTVENPAICKEEEGEKYSESSKDRWFEEYDNLSEPPDAGEMVDDQSDISDYEETYIKKKKKKSSGRGRKKNTEKEAPQVTEEKDKPYSCEEKSGRSGMDKRDISANNYCDFCLGDSEENKKSNQPEELVSCSDCGRSGHPTCLQFTANMIISVKKYPWQCIECKSCGLCGTSDNDDQLLFCDDCDRGYHMYCLNPPLSEPPEGNWSCHLCIEEFHGGKKPQGMQ